MFRSRWGLLSSSAKSVPEIAPERILQILTNSHVVPVGKLTDHFDKTVKSFFSSQDNKRSLVASLLTGDVIELKMKVPEKVRENILIAISEQFDSLNTGELVRIPSLVRRLPATMISSESEDLLLEKFLKKVSMGLLNDLSKERLSVLVRDVARLHVRHPCKEEFVVRFFECLSTAALSSGSRLALLGTASRNLSSQKLAHPIIRKSLLSLVKNMDGPLPLGDSIFICSGLPIFPDALVILDSHIQSRTLEVSKSDLADAIKGCLGLLGIKTTPDMLSSIGQELVDQVRNGGQVSSLLEEIVELRKQQLNAEYASSLVNAISVNDAVGSFASVGGYVRLLLAPGIPQERLTTDMKSLLSTLQSVKKPDDLLPVAYILRGLSVSGSDETTMLSVFKDHVGPRLKDLTPMHVRVMLTSNNESLGSKIIDSSSDPALLVAVLSITGQSAAAEKLSKIVPSVNNTDTLLGLWNALTDSGTAFADPEILASDSPRKRALKELTRAIFRSVRMAPIPVV